MKTEQSYKTELAKLRAEHTEAFHAENYAKMQSIGKRIVKILDTLAMHFPNWKDDQLPAWSANNRPQSETQRKYDELIYAVQRKHQGESRHETALRYIRETEQREQFGGETKSTASHLSTHATDTAPL